ncbi:ATP-binding protein [Actinoplanes sp. CA-252034]|uniref:ATP-binding protein n=1 Tax=Actinoplanes sp. CA-252034 TaxID=3239906 RepID=UPI003D99342A
MTATNAVAARLRSAGALTVAVIVVTLMIAGATFAAMTRGDDDTARRLLQRRASQVTAAVQAEVDRYLGAVATTAAATGAHDTLTNAKFQQLSAPLAGMRLSGATAVSYLLPVADDQITAAQALWRSRGVPDLRLQPVGDGEHVFAVMVRPFDEVTNRAGVDATQARPLLDTLRTARDTGRPAVSEPYALVVDQSVPAPLRQLSFTLAAPVHGLPGPSGEREFRGWVVMSLRSQDFLGNVLPSLTDGLRGATLLTDAEDQAPVAAVHPQADSGAADMSDSGTVEVADRTWRLRIDASRRDLIGSGALPRVVTVAVLALGFVLAALVHVLATGGARARRAVEQATADLAATETRAREQAFLLTTILDAMSDGVGVVDGNGDFLLHNPAAKSMLGIAEDRNGAEHWQAHYGIFLPDDSGPFPTDRLPLVRALAGEQCDLVDMLIRNETHPDGLMISVSARPVRLRGGLAAAVAVFHDVTARRADTAAIEAARDELAAQKDYLTQVLDALQITVITCDNAGMLVHTNATGGARVGQPSLSGRHIDEISAGLTVTDLEGQVVDAHDMPVPRVLRGADAVRLEAMIRFATGKTRAVVLNARPLLDRNGARIGAVGSSYDITALREREADLAAFAGVAAHDLRAPLMVVAGYTELLEQDMADGVEPESMLPTLSRIRVGVHRMQQLIEDLLAYATARDARINVRPVDLQAVMADIIAERTTHLRVAARGSAPKPRFRVGPLPVVDADASMIRQVFDNLIGNALKYTRAGEPACVDITAHHPNGDPAAICVTIADRGIGIPAEEQPHVFDQFHRVAAHTTAYTGTGLGLAICKRVLQRHDGTIRAADNPGGGTRMIITLPYAGPPLPEPANDTIAAVRG